MKGIDSNLFWATDHNTFTNGSPLEDVFKKADPGFYVVFGAPGSGKSRVLSALSALLDSPLIHACEPDPRSSMTWADIVRDLDILFKNCEPMYKHIVSQDVDRSDAYYFLSNGDRTLVLKGAIILSILAGRERDLSDKIDEMAVDVINRLMDRDGANHFLKDETRDEIDGFTDYARKLSVATHSPISPLWLPILTSSTVFIDSIKDALYEGGSLGKGGVSMSLGSKLSSISAGCARYGVKLVGSLNPLVDSPDFTEYVLNFLISNCTGVATLNFSDAKIAMRKWQPADRFFERLIFTSSLRKLKKEESGSRPFKELTSEADRFIKMGQLDLPDELASWVTRVMNRGQMV